MKAAVCYEAGEPLVVEEVVLDPPQANEVRVKLKVTAICHSDVHQIRGDWHDAKMPMVAGHEAAGVVAELGDGVTAVQVGDHVVVSLLWACNQCPPCLSGATYLCETMMPHVKDGRLHTQSGNDIFTSVNTAAFAEEVVVHETQLVVIPNEMPFAAAALLGCGVITGFGAVTNTAKVEGGKSVVVVGLGGVGLNAIQGAVHSGANPIIAIDLIDDKLDAAKSFGATHTVNGANENPIGAIKGLTNGRGADYVFVTVGNAVAVEQGYKMASTLGKVVLVGIPDWFSKASFSIGGTIRREKQIIGSWMGSTDLPIDVPKLVGLYENGRLQLDELVSGRYPLEQINEAIENMESGHALRNVIIFD